MEIGKFFSGRRAYLYTAGLVAAAVGTWFGATRPDGKEHSQRAEDFKTPPARRQAAMPELTETELAELSAALGASERAFNDKLPELARFVFRNTKVGKIDSFDLPKFEEFFKRQRDYYAGKIKEANPNISKEQIDAMLSADGSVAGNGQYENKFISSDQAIPFEIVLNGAKVGYFQIISARDSAGNPGKYALDTGEKDLDWVNISGFTIDKRTTMAFASGPEVMSLSWYLVGKKLRLKLLWAYMPIWQVLESCWLQARIVLVWIM